MVAHTEDELHTKVIFLGYNKKAFWVDWDGVNCFLLLSRDLRIVWGDDERYWRWGSCIKSEPEIEVPDLLKVCWLEVTGKKTVSDLSPGITYKVVLKIMVTDKAYGWEAPVRLKLKTPDGKEQESLLRLNKVPRRKWFQLPFGQYTKHHNHNNDGELEFSLMGTEGLVWKSGIVLDGVGILPITQHCVENRAPRSERFGLPFGEYKKHHVHSNVGEIEFSTEGQAGESGIILDGVEILPITEHNFPNIYNMI